MNKQHIIIFMFLWQIYEEKGHLSLTEISLISTELME